jgi:hypothetical protein
MRCVVLAGGFAGQPHLFCKEADLKRPSGVCSDNAGQLYVTSLTDEVRPLLQRKITITSLQYLHHIALLTSHCITCITVHYLHHMTSHYVMSSHPGVIPCKNCRLLMSSEMPRKSRNEMVPSSSSSCHVALCMGKWLWRGDGYERRTEIESKRVEMTTNVCVLVYRVFPSRCRLCFGLSFGDLRFFFTKAEPQTGQSTYFKFFFLGMAAVCRRLSCVSVFPPVCNKVQTLYIVRPT